MRKDYVAFDLETTGLSIDSDFIIEIGALKVRNGKVVDRFIDFVKPPIAISTMISNITGITNEMVKDARDVSEVIRDFVKFCEDDILIGHNIAFDYKFVKSFASKEKLPFEKMGLDTLAIAKKTLVNLESKKLGALCDYYRVENIAAHRAYHDALATAKIYHMLAHDFEEANPKLFAPKQLQYKPKKVQPCTAKQIAFLQSLCEKYQVQLSTDIACLTRSEASRQIDAILSTHGKIS